MKKDDSQAFIKTSRNIITMEKYRPIAFTTLEAISDPELEYV